MITVSYNVSYNLINSEATLNTKRLMKYLKDCYDKYIVAIFFVLSGYTVNTVLYKIIASTVISIECFYFKYINQLIYALPYTLQETYL